MSHNKIWTWKVASCSISHCSLHVKSRWIKWFHWSEKRFGPKPNKASLDHVNNDFQSHLFHMLTFVQLHSQTQICLPRKSRSEDWSVSVFCPGACNLCWKGRGASHSFRDLEFPGFWLLPPTSKLPWLSCVKWHISPSSIVSCASRLQHTCVILCLIRWRSWRSSTTWPSTGCSTSPSPTCPCPTETRSLASSAGATSTPEVSAAHDPENTTLDSLKRCHPQSLCIESKTSDEQNHPHCSHALFRHRVRWKTASHILPLQEDRRRLMWDFPSIVVVWLNSFAHWQIEAVFARR